MRRKLSLAALLVGNALLLSTSGGCYMDRGLYYAGETSVPTDYVSAISYRPADAGRFDVTDTGKYTKVGWAKYKKFWGEK